MKKKKPVIQNVNTLTPTGHGIVNIYIEGKLIGKTKSVQINTFDLNQN